MRIAVLTTSYPRFPGDGTAPFIQAISETLAELGHDVEVVAPYDPDLRPMPPSRVKMHRFRYIWPARWHIMGHARSLHADVKLVPLSYLLLPFFVLASFINLLVVSGRQPSDIIYAHWVIPNGLAAAWVARIRRVPLFLSLHGSDIYVAKRNPLFRAVARAIFRQAAGITASSPELRRGAIELGAPEATLALPYGVYPAVFHPQRRSEAHRAAFDWQPGEVVIASLGRMVYKKGFGVLVQAFAEIAPRCPEARLAIAGDGPVQAELRDQADAAGMGGRVSLPGRMPWDQAPDFYASADIFVLPSLSGGGTGNQDGLPNVLLEAMSSGAAVVTSDIGGALMVVRNGENGLVFPSGDAHALAAALLRLLQDPALRQRLGIAARQTAETELDWRIITGRIATMMAQILERKS